MDETAALFGVDWKRAQARRELSSFYPGSEKEAPVEESFKPVIEEHLDLMRRNGGLEAALPLSNYLAAPGTPGEPGVFDGAAFDTLNWTGVRQACRQTDRRRSRPDPWLDSLDDLWSERPAPSGGHSRR
jgi:hypothetical protein